MARNRLGWMLLLALIGALAALVTLRHRSPEFRRTGEASVPTELQGVLWPEPRAVAPFHMLTQRGEGFGAEQFRGQWSFVFFGYLSCPDICPTTLLALADFRRRLLAEDPDAKRYRFVFVSVDPANDNAERMSAYVAHFDPDIVGLVGEAGELARLAGSMGAAYAEHIDEQGVRSIEHSTTILLVDPAGRVVGGLPPPHDPGQMLGSFGALRRYVEG